MTERSLLVLYAHPDDESMTGGTLIKLADEGVRVTLVCATRGEVGEISDPALATPETLGAVREEELRCSTRTMGIADPIFLNYRDSGMAGTPENEHSDAFVNADADEVVALLAPIIRELRPQVVLTFDETGGYGHPDHIAIWRHAHAAVASAADPEQLPEAGDAWQVGRIVYSVFLRSLFLGMREKLIELGEDVSELDAFLELGIGFDDDHVHAEIDVAAHVDRKLAAMACHRTQFGGDTFFSRVGDEETRRMFSHEYFVIDRHEPSSGERLRELFP